MATLRFSFGTMGSGKSTLALQIHHNLASRELYGLLLTCLDREGTQVTSRLGVAAPAIQVEPDARPARARRRTTGRSTTWCATRRSSTHRSSAISSARVVDDLEVDVYAFGLITDFRGELFEGTKRLLEIADERVPLQVEARCWCGARATHNARVVNGVVVYEGETVVVGDTADPARATALRRRRAVRAAVPPPLPRRRPRHVTPATCLRHPQRYAIWRRQFGMRWRESHSTRSDQFSQRLARRPIALPVFWRQSKMGQ